MQDKLQQFINETQGRFIEKEDASNYAQCFDLVFAWCDKLGIPRSAIRHLRAYEIWTLANDETRKYFDLVPNGPTNIPPAGSIAVFSQLVGPAGHTSVTLPQSNSNDLYSLDQNWATPKYTRVVQHTKYNGVIGWLVPKQQTNTDDQKEQRIKDILNSPGTSTEHLQKIRQVLV